MFKKIIFTTVTCSFGFFIFGFNAYGQDSDKILTAIASMIKTKAKAPIKISINKGECQAGYDVSIFIDPGTGKSKITYTAAAADKLDASVLKLGTKCN